MEQKNIESRKKLADELRKKRDPETGKFSEKAHGYLEAKQDTPDYVEAKAESVVMHNERVKQAAIEKLQNEIKNTATEENSTNAQTNPEGSSSESENQKGYTLSPQLQEKFKTISPEYQVKITGLIEKINESDKKLELEMQNVKQASQKTINELSSQIEGIKQKKAEAAQSKDSKTQDDIFRSFGSTFGGTGDPVKDLEQKIHKTKIDSNNSVETLKQEKASFAREISRKISQAFVDANPENLEKMGGIETDLRRRIDELVKNAKSPEDREVYEAIAGKINNLKSMLKRKMNDFSDKTGYSPTVQNLQKYFDVYQSQITNFTDENTSFRDIVKELGKKGETYTVSEQYIQTFRGLSATQTKEIFKAFGFGHEKQLRDIYEDYNKKHKGVFARKAVEGKDHDFTLPTANPGVLFQAVNHKGGSGYQSFLLRKNFVEEIINQNV